MRIKSLFFNNFGIKQTIAKNTFWLTIGNGGSGLLKLILLIYVARILGATEYGKFTFALAFIFLFQVFADFGLSQITTREFAKDSGKEKEFFSLLSLKILLGLGILTLVLTFSFFVTSDPVIRKIIWILAISNIISTYFMIFYAFFQARQKMEYEGIMRILEVLILVGLGFFVLFYFPSIENLSYSYLFASLFSLIFILIFFNFRVQKLSLNWDKLIWKKYLLMSWPLALIGFSYIIYNQIDSVMMGYLGQITQTGWYNAAYRIIVIPTIPSGIISASFYPALSKAFKETEEKLQRIWNYHMEIMILLAFPLLVGGVVLASRIIGFFYDSSFTPSVLVFQILIIMVGIMFICTAFRWVLIVADQQKKLFWAVLSGAIINVILNLILIPKFSLYGAAAATVITNILIFFLLVRFTSKFTTINPFNLKILLTFIGAILCSILMYFTITQPQIYYLNVILTILIGIAVYSISLLGYRKLTNQIFKVSFI
jgi:O-antigen/teichoic acid export membrane protein